MWRLWMHDGHVHSRWREVFVGLEDEARAAFAQQCAARKFGRIVLLDHWNQIADKRLADNPPAWP
jgi:hypothetical protein